MTKSLGPWLLQESPRSKEELAERLADLKTWDVSGCRTREALRYLPVGVVPELDGQRDANQVLPLDSSKAGLRALTLVEKLEAAAEHGEIDACRELVCRVQETLWVSGMATRSIEYVMAAVTALEREEAPRDAALAAPFMAMAMMAAGTQALKELDDEASGAAQHGDAAHARHEEDQ